MIVHRAKDAAEAIQIVLDIAKDLPQRRRERKENQKEISVDLRSHLSGEFCSYRQIKKHGL
ncbi:MAG: hypothetical protein IPL71_01845 [Anaerolineales bacterium]|nr:hypothetical protein [Anaerolineales bacterium]